MAKPRGSRAASPEPFPPHRGKPNYHIGAFANPVKEFGFGVLGDIRRYLKVAEGPGTLGVRLAFRNPLPVEVGHLLDEIVVLQQVGPSGPTVSEYSSLATGIPASFVVKLRSSSFMVEPLFYGVR
jgi:hypothetical protein